MDNTNAKWTAEEYRQYQKKQKSLQVGKKYGNQKQFVDGKNFDSAKEAKYWGTLKIRLLHGEVKKIEHHKVYKLNVNGMHVCDYEADFVVTNLDDTITVIDVKSAATEGMPVFSLKRKLMKACHGIEIQIA